jgi:hypothetical protein
MPTSRLQKPGRPMTLTRTEKKAAEIDTSVKDSLEKTRNADLKKIARLKALRMAREADGAEEA